jgi:uncharacterized protein (DUF983 family)
MLRGLLGHLFDFVYWVAVIVGLVLLSPNIESAPLWAAVLAIYIGATIAIYFFLIRRIRGRS